MTLVLAFFFLHIPLPDFGPWRARECYTWGMDALSKGRDKEALLFLRVAALLDSKKAPTLFQLGRLYLFGGKERKAYELFKQTVSLDPNIADAQHNLGILALRFRELDAAKKAFTREIELLPEDPAGYYNLASVFALQGKADQAIYFLKEAMAKGFSDPDYVKGDPDLSPLKRNPSFKALLLEMERKATPPAR